MKSIEQKHRERKWVIVDIKCSDYNTTEDCEWQIGTSPPTIINGINYIVKSFFTDKEATLAVLSHNAVIDLESTKKNKFISIRVSNNIKDIYKSLAKSNNSSLSKEIHKALVSNLDKH